MTISADFDAITSPKVATTYLDDEWNGLARALKACKDVGVALDAATFTLSASGAGAFSSTLGVIGATTLSSTLAVVGVATFDDAVEVDDELALSEVGVKKWLFGTASGQLTIVDSGGNIVVTIEDAAAANSLYIDASGGVGVGQTVSSDILGVTKNMVVTGTGTFTGVLNTQAALGADDTITINEATVGKWALSSVSGLFALTDVGGNAALTIEDGVIANALYLDAAGHFGIGVDPSATYGFDVRTGNDWRFHNKADAAVVLAIGGGSVSEQIVGLAWLDKDDNEDWLIQVAATGEMQFITVSTAWMTVEAGANAASIYVDAAGHIGFGADPTATFDFLKSAATGVWKFDCTGDAAAQLQLDAGLSVAQIIDFKFLDQGTTKWTLRKDASNQFSIGSSAGLTLFMEDAAPALAIYVDADGHVGFGANPGSGIDFYVAKTSVVLCRFKATDNSSLTFEMDAGTSVSQTIDFSFADQGLNHYKLRSQPGSSLFRVRDEVSNHNWMSFTEGGGVQIGVPTGADNGQGTLNANAVYDDNVLLTCYVAEAAADGRIDLDAWDNRVANRRDIKADIDPEEFYPEGHKLAGARRTDADRYRGDIVITTPTPHTPARAFAARAARTLDLKSYCEDFRANRHLPSMPHRDDWDKNKKMGIGDMGQRLWEEAEVAVVHRDQLLKRIEALEELVRGRP